MSELLKSATKLSLLAIIINLCILTYVWVVEWKDFVMVAMVIVGFYFKDKTNTPNQPTQ